MPDSVELRKGECHEPLKPIDPSHESIRPVLRLLGPMVLVLGLICFLGCMPLVVYTGHFAFGFLGFLGVFLLFIGGVMAQFGYKSAVARYQAQELAPVASDTFNYVAEETKPGVRAIVGAVREELVAVTK